MPDYCCGSSFDGCINAFRKKNIVWRLVVVSFKSFCLAFLLFGTCKVITP
jgi:hypothetical protein